MLTVGFNNGAFQPLHKIQIPITSLSVNRGYGAYEFLEVTNRTAFYGHRHIARLRNSMKLLKLKTEFDNELESIIQKVIELQERGNFYLKIFALPHQSADGEYYAAALYMFPAQIPVFDEVVYTKGVKLLLKQFQRFLPEAKSTDYLSGQFWNFEMQQAHAVDVLYYYGNNVLESSRGNIFMVKNNRVFTPQYNILKGITRSVVLDILKTEQMQAVECDLTIDELLKADEVFLTSTTKLIMPIVNIDNTIIGNGLPGQISGLLINRFRALKEVKMQDF